MIIDLIYFVFILFFINIGLEISELHENIKEKPLEHGRRDWNTFKSDD